MTIHKRNVLVLGGKGDIGIGIVQKFREMGDLVTSLGREDLDLTRIEAIHQYCDKHRDPVDVLVHSAGFNEPKPMDKITPADLSRTLDVNTLGFFWMVQRLAPQMKEKGGGHILALSSIYGSFSRVGRLSYSTAKHALNGMIKTLALELGPHHIRVNALSPGFVDTKMTRKNNDTKKIQEFERQIPLGRLATPKDIAEVAYFLCSPQNTFLHGQNVTVDGGFSIGGFQNS